MLAPLAAPFSQGYIDPALTVTILVGLLQLAVGVLRLGCFRISSRLPRCWDLPAARRADRHHALRDLFGFGSEAGHGTGELLRTQRTIWGRSIPVRCWSA